MELTHLRHFFFVAQARSFTMGAKLAHVSPPAISKTIKRLEEEIGAPLFERTTRRVNLTESGEILLARCRQIFEHVDSIRRDLDDASTSVRGELRVAAMEVFSIYLLPMAVTRMVKQYPEVIPRTHEMLPDLMERHIADGTLDVGFTVGGGGSREVNHETLGTSPGIVVCGKAHPLYTRGRINAALVGQHAFVVPRFFQRDYLPMIDQFPDETYPRRVGATIELLQMGIQLTIAGAYLGYFPEVSVRHHLRSGSLRALAGLKPGRPFELRALSRRGAPPRAAVGALIAEVKRVLSAL